MGKNPRPYESLLSPQLAQEILNIPVTEGFDGQPPRTIGEMVQRWGELIARTNEQLQHSALAKIVARSIMQDLKKRGDASIVVRHDGSVILRVSYAESDASDSTKRTRRDAPSVQTMHRTSIPYLDALREEAAVLGVDISHFGRQRRAIHEYLQAHRQKVKGVDQVSVTKLGDADARPPRAAVARQ